MSLGSYATGQAVFLRTDTPNFEERAVPFSSLEELVELCTKPRPNLTLEKIIVYRLQDEESTAVTLGFIAATKGQKMPVPHVAEQSTDQLLDAAAEPKKVVQQQQKAPGSGAAFTLYDLYD
jgi:hypothetical protein